jgi:hypothetical protein
MDAGMSRAITAGENGEYFVVEWPTDVTSGSVDSGGRSMLANDLPSVVLCCRARFEPKTVPDSGTGVSW